jgi:hypothetical protein
MTESQEPSGVPPAFADQDVQTWFDEHLPQLKRAAFGQRLLYQSLVFAFIVGLAAHVGGYFLLLAAPTGLLGLSADLLHALGWSLWTGVVVTVFVQVIPEVKRRQIRQSLEEYEALRRGKAQDIGPARRGD